MAAFLDILTLAYGATGFVSLAGYLPQFVVYWRSRRACQDAPLSSWLIWSGQSAIVILYAAAVNGDVVFILASLMGGACNFVGLALVLRGRLPADPKARSHAGTDADRPVPDALPTSPFPAPI